jgi:hypothetical protein
MASQIVAATISHGEQQLDDQVLEELRRLAMDAVEQVVPEPRVEQTRAGGDHRIEPNRRGGGIRLRQPGRDGCFRPPRGRCGQTIMALPLLDRPAALEIGERPLQTVAEDRLLATRQAPRPLLPGEAEAGGDSVHKRPDPHFTLRFRQRLESRLHQLRIIRYHQAPLRDPVQIRHMLRRYPLQLRIPCQTEVSAYILKMPKRLSGTGAFRQARKAKPSTSRVSSGAITPSSHSRAVA